MQYMIRKLKGVKGPAALSQLNILKGIRLTSHASRLTVFTVFAFLVGCAAPQKEVKRRFFWPPLPDTPRVEWLAAYASQHDLPKAPGQAFRESIVGREEAKGFEKPWGIASDGEGKVYVVDTGSAQVAVYDFVNNKVDVLGKGEYAGAFKAPVGIALDGAGKIYVSDSKTNKILVYDKEERPLMAIESEELDWPTGIAVNDKLGRIYVANAHKHSIAAFDLNGKHLFSFGKRGGGDGEFNFPSDIDMDGQGNLVVADSMNARVQILDPDGKFIRKFGQRGDGVTDFQVVKGIAVDRATGNIYVVDGRANRYLIFNKEGEPLLSVGGAASVKGMVFPGGFLLPADIAIDKSGRVYVVDSLNRRFQVFKIVDDAWLKEHPIDK